MKVLSTTDSIQHLQLHPSFGGCFPLDKIPPITHFPTSIVVNTDKAGEKGGIGWPSFWSEDYAATLILWGYLF